MLEMLVPLVYLISRTFQVFKHCLLTVPLPLVDTVLQCLYSMKVMIQVLGLHHIIYNHACEVQYLGIVNRNVCEWEGLFTSMWPCDPLACPKCIDASLYDSWFRLQETPVTLN